MNIATLEKRIATSEEKTRPQRWAAECRRFDAEDIIQMDCLLKMAQEKIVMPIAPDIAHQWQGLLDAFNQEREESGVSDEAALVLLSAYFWDTFVRVPAEFRLADAEERLLFGLQAWLDEIAPGARDWTEDKTRAVLKVLVAQLSTINGNSGRKAEDKALAACLQIVRDNAKEVPCN